MIYEHFDGDSIDEIEQKLSSMWNGKAGVEDRIVKPPGPLFACCTALCSEVEEAEGGTSWEFPSSEIFNVCVFLAEDFQLPDEGV